MVFLDLDDFYNQNYFYRVGKYEVNRDELSFLAPIQNLSADDRVFVVTKKSRFVRLGKIRLTGNGTAVDPFDLEQWDATFIEALRREKEELYMRLLPAGVDLESKLLIGVTVPVVLAQPDNHNPGPQDAQPVLDLPVLDFDGAGRVNPEALFAWVKGANELALGQGGLRFGNLAKSLPDILEVGNVHYQPAIERYGVFPGINGARVVERVGGIFGIDVDSQINRNVRGVLFTRRYPAEAVESVEKKVLPDFIGQVIEGQRNKWMLSIINHVSGTVVVDNVEVESIKRVCKKGKKLYRMFLKPEPVSLNSRVYAGSYRMCSLWVQQQIGNIRE
jgi:hypothetical protein